MEAEDLQTEELYRKFQGILNKLTPTNFQKLAEQALKLDITTEARLSGCIDKIFTKVGVVKGCGQGKCHHYSRSRRVGLEWAWLLVYLDGMKHLVCAIHR